MTDRLPRQPPGDSIVEKGPIIIGTDPPKGYIGIRTTVQIRDGRSAGQDQGFGKEFVLDVIVNSEIRRGSRTQRQRQAEQKIIHDHREITALLMDAIKQASENQSE